MNTTNLMRHNLMKIKLRVNWSALDISRPYFIQHSPNHMVNRNEQYSNSGISN